MKNIAKPVHPMKVLFLSSVLLLSGCTKFHADPNKIFTASQVSKTYWKYVAERNCWALFDEKGQRRSTVFLNEGLYLAEWHDGVVRGYEVQSTYDTLEHAQRASEAAVLSPPIEMNNVTFFSSN